MSTARWPTVLFDLDGTLVDTIPLIVASYEHAMRTVLPEVSFTPEQARAWIGQTLRTAFAESHPEHAEALEAAYVPYNLANTARLIARYDGVEALVRALLDAEVRIGVATSKRAETAATALRHAGLDTLIDLVATMESTDRHKPDPAPLRHGAARLSTPVERCVYVGDAVVDVQAAKAAGMASVAVTWGAGVRESLAAAGPDHLVDTPAELTAILLPPNGTDLGP
ncbi:MAG: HAD-IA family hydrolase [Tetrasphaera sp.]